MTQQMKVKAKFDNWLNLDAATKSLVNFFMSDAGLYMYGNYQYTPATKASFMYTEQVSHEAVQIILRGEAAEAGTSGNRLSLSFYKDASKVTVQLLDSNTPVFKYEKSYTQYDDSISAYDIDNATNALNSETKGSDFFWLEGNMPLEDISNDSSDPTKFDFTGGRDAVDNVLDGIKASILQNHRTFTLTENDDVEYTSLWVPYTNTSITDDVDVVSNSCSIPDVASTLTQATSNLYLSKYTYQETGGGSGSGSGGTATKAHGQSDGILVEAANVGTTSSDWNVKFHVSDENCIILRVYDEDYNLLFEGTLNSNMQNSVTGDQLNTIQGENIEGSVSDGHVITEYVTFSGSVSSGWNLDDVWVTLSDGTSTTKASGKTADILYVEAADSGETGNSLKVEIYDNSSAIVVDIYNGADEVFSSRLPMGPSAEYGTYITANALNELIDDGLHNGFAITDFVLFTGSITVLSEHDSENPIVIQLYGGENSSDSGDGNTANLSNTSLIDSMSAAAKHNYLVSGISLNKSVTIKPYIGDNINTDSSMYPSEIGPYRTVINVDFNIGEDDRVDFQLRTSSFTVEDEANLGHFGMYYRIGIYPLNGNTVDDVKDMLITDVQHNDGRRLVTGMTGTTYDDKVFYLDHLYHDVADMFYVESNFDNGTSRNFPIKAIFPYRGSYISNYDAILYMQLCNSDGTPSDSIGVIRGIEVSLDGETWNTAEYTGDTNMAALDIAELTEENKASFISVSINE